MKDVLISVRPQWVEKIFHKIGEIDGKPIYEKEIEIRKDKPMQVQVPFKCFIYETYDKKYDGIGVCWEKGNTFEHACKKVIGEFTCDRIILIDAENSPCLRMACKDMDIDEFEKQACLSAYELLTYLSSKNPKLEYVLGYGWHISDLKIYDKPKALSEFGIKCESANEIHCRDCLNKNDSDFCEKMIKPLIRPPQSWCYVEVDK